MTNAFRDAGDALAHIEDSLRAGEFGPMKTEDIKHLADFHAQHDTSEKVVCCEWCHKQVPISQASLVPTEVDDETGMATDEVNVCHTCLPEHDEPVIDETDEEESSEDRLERQAQAHLESAALHRDDPMF